MSDGVSISTGVNVHIVDSARWPDMNFSELLSQKGILFNRYEYLVQAGVNPTAAKNVLDGINLIDSLIAQKSIK